MPATVQAVLAARIDRLPPEEKRLLQTAAVIGKDVPFALLQAIADAARGGAAPRPRPPPGRGVPLRDAPLPGPRVHVQARADPRGGVREPAPGAAARAPRPDRRGHRGLYARPAGRAGRAAGAPRLPGRGVGEGGHLSPPGRAPRRGALGLPRGRRLLRAGARGAGASPREPRRRSSRRSICASICATRSSRSASRGACSSYFHEAEAPRPDAGRRAPARTGRHVSWRLSFWSTGRPRRAVDRPARASRSRATLGDVGLQVAATFYLGSAYLARATIRGRSTLLRRNVSARRRATGATASGWPPSVSARAGWLAMRSPSSEVRRGRRTRAKRGAPIADAVDHPSASSARLRSREVHLRHGDLRTRAQLLERASASAGRGTSSSRLRSLRRPSALRLRPGRAARRGAARWSRSRRDADSPGSVGGPRSGPPGSPRRYLLAGRAGRATRAARRRSTLARGTGAGPRPRPPPPRRDRRSRDPPTPRAAGSHYREALASPTSSACAPSSPTATSASASSTGAPATQRRPGAPDHRDDDVPRDGHELLAGEGRRGAAWSRAMTRVLSMVIPRPWPSSPRRSPPRLSLVHVKRFFADAAAAAGASSSPGGTARRTGPGVAT